MGKPKSRILPLIPLEKGVVLLPGVHLRIPVQTRSDVAAILAHVYGRTALSGSSNTVTVGCVPLKSPFLSADGKSLLIEGVEGVEGQAGSGLGYEETYESVDRSQVKRDDLFSYGTVAKISGVQGRGKGELALVVEGIGRFRVEDVLPGEQAYFEGRVVPLEDEVNTSNPTVQALFTELKQASREFLALIRLSPLLSNGPASSTLSPLLARRLDMIVARKEIQDAGLLADFMANAVDCTTEEKLRILSALSVKDRLEMVNEIIKRQIAGFQSKTRIMTFTTTTTNPASGLDVDRLRMLQQEAILRRTGSSFPSGFSGFPPGSPGSGGQGGEEEPSEVEELKKKLSDANLSVEAQQVAKRELRRLQKMNPVQAEYQVCRNYLETLADIPWTKVTADKLGGDTLERARKQLDDDHYGLRKIKKRLLEYLAVLKLKQAVNVNLQAKIQHLRDQAKKAEEQSSQTERQTSFNESPESLGRGDAEQKILDTKRMVEKSPILLLVGPPGTGKTSLAKSIATALGRKFHRISLGGVRDEAEIRGHRRTYVAAMPGLIVNGLKKVGVANPVFLLDELDKVGTSNFHGDPSAAMLEVLDPEQNHTFTDHYVNIPIDLSKVLFIATANTLETIPPPLLDRLETIHLSGYTTLEKKHIATRHLIPKQITTNGLETDALKLQPDALDQVITAYTREAGVRSLEREIGAICRYKAVEYSSALDSSTPEKYNSLVTLSDLESILGQERYEEELAAQSSRPGVVTGLVAYSSGGQGSILFVEVTDFPSSGPSSSSATRITLTGKLGDVLKESVEVALTWVRAHAFSLGIATDPNEDILKARGVHVHCPAGAVPKDGPSAGLAHAVALVSLFSGRSVPPQIAMTGEVSLRGKVTPVGGIAEKLIGALRAGVRTVLLPAGNRKDVKDLPAEVREGLDIVHVQHIWEALRHIWPDVDWPGEAHWSGIDSRL